MTSRSSRSSPPTAGLLQPAQMQSVRAAAGQSASQTRPTVSSEDPHFHARARSGARIFLLELAPELPKFDFGMAHA